VTTVGSSENPAMAGDAVTFIATINPQNPNANTISGTVQFQSDGSNLGSPITVAAFGSQASASVTTSSLPAGTHTITATYSGDTNFSGSIGTLSGGETVTANSSSTTTTVASSVNPSVLGQPVTFTATVTPGGAGTPTGSVSFFDGASSIGQGTLS